MKDVNGQEVVQRAIKQIQQGAFLVVQAEERKNLMTIGWAMFGFVWRRPTMMIAVRKSRFTHQLIEEADSFTVGVPTGNMEKEINFCGSKSGRDWDKFKECHLATGKARKVRSPILTIPGYHFECRIIYKTSMDPKWMAKDLGSIYPEQDYHTLYFGEILACSLIE
jgi:flavin reductase (DIM6/NTAB) family NADH-FMN oxidoreductase RutF